MTPEANVDPMTMFGEILKGGHKDALLTMLAHVLREFMEAEAWTCEVSGSCAGRARSLGYFSRQASATARVRPWGHLRTWATSSTQRRSCALASSRSR